MGASALTCTPTDAAGRNNSLPPFVRTRCSRAQSTAAALKSAASCPRCTHPTTTGLLSAFSNFSATSISSSSKSAGLLAAAATRRAAQGRGRQAAGEAAARHRHRRQWMLRQGRYQPCRSGQLRQFNTRRDQTMGFQNRTCLQALPAAVAGPGGVPKALPHAAERQPRASGPRSSG